MQAMTKAQIEAWAVRCIEAAQSNSPYEDSFVEFKREFPVDTVKAARRIAGHANAARNQPILWIIGVSGKGEVFGAEHHELADWWCGVQSHFDGPIPSLRDSVVYLSKPVLALLFETEQPPYVVKMKGGLLEVPWREATGVRSARHVDLLKILSTQQKAPQVETVFAQWYFDAKPDGTRSLLVDLYITLPRGEDAFFRFRDCSLTLRHCKSNETIRCEPGTVEGRMDRESTQILKGQLHVRTSAQVSLMSALSLLPFSVSEGDSFEVYAILKSVHSDVPAKSQPVTLGLFERGKRGELIWKYMA